MSESLGPGGIGLRVRGHALTLGVVALALALAGVPAITSRRNGSARPATRAVPHTGMPLVPNARQAIELQAPGPRPVFPLSVIPGGVYSLEELERARRTDRVVARHYVAFSSRPRFEKAHSDLLVYVSYRRRDQIFWTRTARRIPRGEALMLDGARMARARCGNQLALTPQFPTETEEPEEDVLDSPQKLDIAPEIRFPEQPKLADFTGAAADILGTGPAVLLNPAGPTAEGGGPFLGAISQPLFLGGAFGRLPAITASAPGRAFSSPSGASFFSTSSDSAVPGASIGVPSATPPLSMVPEPGSTKNMFLAAVLCIGFLKVRKSAGTK